MFKSFYHISNFSNFSNNYETENQKVKILFNFKIDIILLFKRKISFENYSMRICLKGLIRAIFGEIKMN